MGKSDPATLAQNDSILRTELDRIDRTTLFRVAAVPLLLIPIALVLVHGGIVPADVAKARLYNLTVVFVLAQAIGGMLLAKAGRIRAGLYFAMAMGLLVIFHNSLIMGMGLRSTTLSSLATLCFLATFLLGIAGANVLAFIGLGSTLVIAVVVAATPEAHLGNAVGQVQPTAMLVSCIGLFINTMIICGAYNQKKGVLLAHIARQTTDLQEALNQRRSALRARQDLLGQIAHNLRTPLATVRTALQLMERTATQPERQARYAANLQTASEKIVWQTRQFSLYDQIQSGQVKVNANRVALEPLLQSMLDAYQVQAKQRNTELALTIGKAVPAHVDIDESLLAHILRNILDNAMKYTSDGHVQLFVNSVDLVDSDCQLNIEIQDSGPGLHPTIQTQLFEPFVQGQENPANAMEGSGLGLFIVRGLARLMGGDAEVSNLPQGGCRVRFSIRTRRGQMGVRQAA